MKRKTWALVLAAAAALSMTACGGSSKPAETAAKAEETTAAPVSYTHLPGQPYRSI